MPHPHLLKDEINVYICPIHVHATLREQGSLEEAVFKNQWFVQNKMFKKGPGYTHQDIFINIFF